jgi:uncharacterized protein (DUF1330 family)
LHFNGRHVIRSDKIAAITGSLPKRFVVIAFDSLDRAKSWSMSAPAKEFEATRGRVAKSRSCIAQLVLVEIHSAMLPKQFQ